MFLRKNSNSRVSPSRAAFSIALFAVGVLLWGCGGSGCGGGNCTPIGCPAPKDGLSDNILGHVAYGDTPTSDTIVASVGSDGDIYFQLTGSDPSQGPNWISWAHYFKLHPFGLHDWDQAVITFYPDASQSCDTSTTNYYLQDNKLSLQVTWDESDVSWEAGEHDVIMTITDPGTQPLVGLPNCLSADDPDKTITVKVHLWDADLLGPDTVERGENAEYEMKHDDLPTTYVLGYYWNSSWGSGHVDFPGNGTLTQNETWEGTLVTTNTQITCGMRVRPPFMTDSIIYRSTETLVTARNWHLDPPQNPIMDQRNDWLPRQNITFPEGSQYDRLGAIICNATGNPQLVVIQSRIFDSRSESPFPVHPNVFDPVWGGPTDIDGGPYSAITYEEITDGPNTGLWYIGSAQYEIDMEVVINKWLRQGGPNPGNSSTNWFDENTSNSCFATANLTPADLIAALRAHEGLGLIDTDNDSHVDSGHYAQLLSAEQVMPDLNLSMESLMGISKLNVASQVSAVYSNIVGRLNSAASSHTHVYGNWLNLSGGQTPSYVFRSWFTSDPNSETQAGSWGLNGGPCDCLVSGSDADI